ncbi:uncharacterized protein J3R85_020443 [Psidium guajava]|nr:uncharacterized protein J3R85_020443 [Psidium guajava]
MEERCVRTFISRGFCKTTVRMPTVTTLECMRWVTCWLGSNPVSQFFAFRMDEKLHNDGRRFTEFFPLLYLLQVLKLRFFASQNLVKLSTTKHLQTLRGYTKLQRQCPRVIAGMLALRVRSAVSTSIALISGVALLVLNLAITIHQVTSIPLGLSCIAPSMFQDTVDCTWFKWGSAGLDASCYITENVRCLVIVNWKYSLR